MLRIGDGEAPDAARPERRLEPGELWIDLELRALRREQHEAPGGVEMPLISRFSLVRELEHEAFVSRHEDLERRALRDLSVEIARGAEYELHLAFSRCVE